MDDFWDFHVRGDKECEACAVGPNLCPDCGGLLHTHFEDDLNEAVTECDNNCGRVPTPTPLEEV